LKKLGTRTLLEREEDLVLTARLYARSWTYKEIANIITEKRAYSISFVTVGKDVKEIQKRWQERQQSYIDSHVAATLVKLEAMEREAWDAYERSKRPKKSVIEKRAASITKSRPAAALDTSEIDDLFSLETAKMEANKPLEIPDVELTDLSGSSSYEVTQQVSAEQRDGCPKWFKIILDIQDKRLDLIQYVEAKAGVSNSVTIKVTGPAPADMAAFIPKD